MSSNPQRDKELTDDDIHQSLQDAGKDGDAPRVVVKTTDVFYLKLDQIEQEIKQLENSEEYKTLAKKNRAWALPKPTEQEKGEWQDLKDKLDDLKKKEEFYQKAILSTINAHAVVKKSDKIRKQNKIDTAIEDERRLLASAAIKMWERFQFQCEFDNSPTFDDLMWAAGFNDRGDARDYFRKKENGQVEEDEIKESFTEEAWILLLELNQRVNALLHDTLTTKQDGSLRLVLEHDVYEDGAGMAQSIIQTIYGPEKKVDIIQAARD
jgi:hypothetical protein